MCVISAKVIFYLLVLFTYFILTNSIQINVDLCHPNMEINISDGIFLSNNSIKYDGLIYNEKNYYYYNYTDVTEYIGCPCKFNVCYRKCCSNGEILNKNLNCLPMNITPNVQIYENEDHETNLTLDDFLFIHGSNCDTGVVIKVGPTEKGNFYFQKDGSLYYEIENYEYTREMGHYCIDLQEEYGDVNIIALVCTKEETKDNSTARNTYAGIMLIALPFVLATFLIYALIPELRKTSHGKCIACYTISYFIASLFLCLIYLLSYKFTQKLCVGAGFISYTAYMATFFWLNAMCIDVWWTFSGRRGFRKNEYDERKKFIIFCCYAWGAAGLSLCIALALQYTNRKLIPSNIVRPEIGIITCWFSDSYHQGYYMYGPILVITVVNCILFIWTGINIYRIKNETKKFINQTSDSHRHVNESTGVFKFYLKLFLAFGINWSFEVIPWLIGESYAWQEPLNIFNTLYGILIFIISCCNKKVFNLLRKKMNILIDSINSNTTSTTVNSPKTPTPNIVLNDIKTK